MIAADDSWFVRFPDGRVIHVANTSVVRQNIQQRHIIAGCMMRRSGDDEWRPFERFREFADLMASGSATHQSPRELRARDPAPGESASGVAARLDPHRLGTAGILPILQDAVAALDTSLTQRKLIASALLAASCGAILATTALAAASSPGVADYVWPIAGTLCVLITLAGLGLLARLTYVELQRMRPAQWNEGTAALVPLTCRLIVAHALAAVVLVGVPAGLLALSRWVLPGTTGAWNAVGAGLAHVSAILALLATVCFIPLGVASLLLAPTLVFEECSAIAAVWIWVGLLRRNLGRVVLNEVVLVAIAGLLAGPLLLTVWATGLAHFDERLTRTVEFARTVLTFLALTPAFSFLAVANVFLFVNLRYQMTHRRSRVRAGD
jgi:hypothetical protein